MTQMLMTYEELGRLFDESSQGLRYTKLGAICSGPLVETDFLVLSIKDVLFPNVLGEGKGL
jgi:hypothetical protein